MVSEQKRILIVDDEPDIRDLLSMLLEAEGYRVSQAANGLEAIDAALASPPDLMLLDLMMPEVNGLEVCQRLRRQASTRRVPIVVLSAMTQGRAVQDALDAGADAFITKPYEDEVVLRKVAEFLDESAF